MKKYKIYAAGQFVDTPGTLSVYRPYDGKLFAETGLADYNLLDDVIIKAKAAEDKMKSLPAYEKSGILERIAAGMINQKSFLAEILCQEAGKPVRYALAEVERTGLQNCL